MRSAIGVTRALLLIGIAASPVIVGAQLNPTVKVLKRPASTIPAECEEGIAPQQAQRVTPEERSAVRDTSRDMLPPPSRTLRTELEAAVGAAQRSARDQFRDSLQRAKSLLGTYPPGAERNAANEVVDVLNDVDTVWDYEFTSSTGAFFDTNGDIFRIASKYPGWDAYVRRQIVVDQNGNRFYPSRETRDFLVGEAAARLARLTGRPAPPRPIARAPIVPPTPRHATSGGQVPSSVRTEKTHRTKRSTTTPARTTTTRATAKTTTTTRTVAHKPAHSRRTSPSPSPSRSPSRTSSAGSMTTTRTAPPPTLTPSPIATTTTSAPPSIATTASAAPPPSTTATFSTDTMSSTPPSTTSSAETQTTATTSTTASAAPAQQQQPAQSRSFFGPIILIIVGLGVLVMLWRASS